MKRLSIGWTAALWMALVGGASAQTTISESASGAQLMDALQDTRGAVVAEERLDPGVNDNNIGAELSSDWTGPISEVETNSDDAADALTEQSAPPPTVDVSLTFEYNSFALTADARRFLDEFAAAYLAAGATWRMEVAGHTDARGSAAYNMTLSQKRAAAVALYLVERGLDGESFDVIGYGEERLKVDTQAAEPANRRVQFTNIGG